MAQPPGTVGPMALQIFRVLVRGRFGPLDAAARARLLDELPHHAVASAGFSETGTLTYDRTLDSFGFRQQVRVRTDEGDADDAGDAEALRPGPRRAIRRGRARRQERDRPRPPHVRHRHGVGLGARDRRDRRPGHAARGGGPPRDP